MAPQSTFDQMSSSRPATRSRDRRAAHRGHGVRRVPIPIIVSFTAMICLTGIVFYQIASEFPF